MGIKRYKEPMGDDSKVGRLMKVSFTHDIGGQRMMRGEQIFRTYQVVAVEQTISADGHTTCMAKIFSQHKASLAPGGAYTTSIKFKSMTYAETNMAYQHMLERQEKLVLSLATAARLGQNPLKDPKFKFAAEILVCASQGYSPIIPARWSLWQHMPRVLAWTSEA